MLENEKKKLGQEPMGEIFYRKRLPSLRYYNVLKQESSFTLGVNAAKNILVP